MKLNIEKICWGGVYFHPDLIRATSLNDKFFQLRSFRSTSSFGQRKKYFIGVCSKNQSELEENIDVHSQYIIVSIELLLNYARFYGRQMITSQTNKSIITQIENILNKYFTETKLKNKDCQPLSFC
jgi:hypothetical protein